MNPIAFDTESTYEKGRDIRSLGVAKYVRHEHTDHYLASAVDGNAVSVCKFPEDFPWEAIHDRVLVIHNAAYDLSVINELKRRGIVGANIQPAEAFDSADLAAYLQCARSLESVMANIYGIRVDKGIRAQMKGRTWNDLNAKMQADVIKYCLHDSELCHKFWMDYEKDWPLIEKRASQHTIKMCMRGVCINLDHAGDGIEKMSRLKHKCEKLIPWAGSKNAKGKELAITSIIELNKECRRLNIPAPACTDTKDEEFTEWLEMHEEDAPFVKAVSDWRKYNRLEKVLLAIRDRNVDGVLPYSLKYFGAPHTGRWAGDEGLNMHNFPRKPLAGFDARACLIPRPGFKFVTADLAQIEARVAIWLGGDESLLQPMRDGLDIYEIHARRTMGYTDKRPLAQVDQDMRQLAKCQVLALNFGMGPAKFIRTVKQWTGQDVSAMDAQNLVSKYRRANKPITKIWTKLEDGLHESEGGDYEVEMPSGRVIRYFGVGQEKGQYFARVELGAPTKYFYGGKLFENLVQGIARDLLARAILRVEAAGFPVVLHVHDEIIAEVPENEADDCAQEINEMMEVVPSWAEGLPIAAEVKVRDCYGK